MEKNIKLIAFDVNGTILDDFNVFSEALNSIFDYFKKPRMSAHELRNEFTQPWTGIYRKRGITENKTSEEFLYKLYNKAYQVQPSAKPFSDLESSLKWIKDKNITTAIISTQQNIITDRLLKQYNLHRYFDFHLGGVADKTEVLQNLVKKLKIKPEQTMYVGDQDSDMRFAKDANCIAIAFTRGVHSKEKLQNAGAQYFINNFTQLIELLQNYER